MKKIMEVLNALLGLARLAKAKPDDKANIEKATRAVAELLKGTRPKDVLNVYDEIVLQGFSSSSDTMDPDGKGGIVWAPERSRIYCDCFFKLADALKYTVMAPDRDLCGKIVGWGMNISTMVSFCRWLKLTQPLPNLLSFEGRNEAAKLLKPRMPELTEYILSLINQAKELEKQNRYDEAQKARDNAKRLNEVYGKMEQRVFPWLEKVEKKKEEKKEGNPTLGQTLGVNSSNELARVLREVIKETK